LFFWTIFIYCPIAHWLWNNHGWAHEWGILDFAGGYVVHISTGFSALAFSFLKRTKKE
jgi:Amt family ammonium transporter